MTAATLDGRVFEPSPIRPPWLRPLVIAIVVALHAAALWRLPYLAQPAPQPPGEVIVDIEPEAPPAETPAPPAEEPKPREKSATAPPPPAPPDAAPAPVEPPPPVAEAPPPEPTPPIAVAPPPVAEQPPLPPPVAVVTPPEEQPPLPPPEPPPPPAPVELQPPKPPPPPRIEPRPKPAEPVRPRSETAEPKPPSAAPRKTASLETGRPEASTSRSAPTSAASQSAYISEISGVIRGRLFYPEAARARGARGVVGVDFTIGPSGAVAAFAITRSSGDRELDAAARTLVQSTHFPPPPGGTAHVATSFNYAPR